jgi:hypothetical protein
MLLVVAKKVTEPRPLHRLLEWHVVPILDKRDRILVLVISIVSADGVAMLGWLFGARVERRSQNLGVCRSYDLFWCAWMGSISRPVVDELDSRMVMDSIGTALV